MFASSEGKCARKPHASTQIGTRGLPEVVAITKGTPALTSASSAAGVFGVGVAAIASRALVSAFCCASRVGSAALAEKMSASVFSPSFARCVSTAAASGEAVSAHAARSRAQACSIGSSPPDAARSASTFSSMNSKALPAFSTTKASRAASSPAGSVASSSSDGMKGASSQKATSIAGASVSPSVPSKSKRTPTISSKRLTRRPARAAHTEASCARLSGFRGPVGGERVPAAPRRGAGPILSHCASRAAVAAALCRRSSGRPLGSAALSLRDGLAHPRRLEWLCGYLAGSPRTRLARRAFLRLPSAACASLVGAVGTRRLPRALARPAECGRVSCARAPRAPSTACAHARLLPCASVRAAIVSSPSPPSPALPSPPPPCRLRPHGHRGAHRHPLRRPPAPAVAPPASQPTATEPAPAFATTTLATTAPATAQHVYRRLSSARVPVPPWHRRDHGPRCGVVLVVACCGAGIQQQSNVCCRLRARRCVGR
mmetsp:Transcript_35378/g.113730  ORF Transcript_35378/g.113730 Transcript_35378/m.113730 type:complete len:488 (-) Transcript_35378:155-1618(-)